MRTEIAAGATRDDIASRVDTSDLDWPVTPVRIQGVYDELTAASVRSAGLHVQSEGATLRRPRIDVPRADGREVDSRSVGRRYCVRGPAGFLRPLGISTAYHANCQLI